MRVLIKGTAVIFSDDQGHDITITTDQLLEFLRILNISFRDDGSTVFETLEFTV